MRKWRHRVGKWLVQVATVNKGQIQDFNSDSLSLEFPFLTTTLYYFSAHSYFREVDLAKVWMNRKTEIERAGG